MRTDRTGLPGSDVEAGPDLTLEGEAEETSETTDDNRKPLSALRRRYKQFEWTLRRYNVESRGIERVLPAHRHTTEHLGFVQICVLWVSINLTANNTTLGMLGPTVFYLSFRDSCLCAVFGMLVGCLPVAYIATFGPRSGNRTMVLSRYIMGWWPSKLIVILTLIILLGYSLIDVVIAGQILSAVSTNGSLSIVVRTVRPYGTTCADILLGRHHHYRGPHLGRYDFRLWCFPSIRALRMASTAHGQYDSRWSGGAEVRSVF